MSNLPVPLVLPLLCLVVVIMSMIVALVVLRRNTRAIQDKVREYKSSQMDSEGVNTRWARADLKGESSPGAVKMQLEPCPECGGENPVGSVECQFCGRKL